MTDTLNVKRRDETGTLRMRRMRKAGHIPAILYGHGEDSISLTLLANEVNAMIRHGSHIVQLTGDLKESALVKQIQWDQLGSDVMHLDLSRIDAKEEVEVAINIELRGLAPGTKQGGILNQSLHEVTIACAADILPEQLEINVNELEVNETITASQITLPAGAKLVTPGDEIVVTCAEPKAEEETEEPADFTAEPEVIGGAKDDESQEGAD